MTPKEKAIELFDKMYMTGIDEYNSKICGLIAVDEIIQSHYYASSGIKPMIYDYWQEVKQEIEKL
jgi:hypothetical protein